MDIASLPDYGDRKNRCATCGLFALRAPGTNAISSADATARTGEMVWSHARPECAVAVLAGVNLYREVAGDRDKHAMYALTQEQRTAEIRAVLETERDGAHWMPWRPHFSPTWHLEHRDMLQLEQSRRDFELRLQEMELEARKSSEQISRDSLDIAKALKATTEATGRFTTRWTYVAVTLALTSVVLVVLSYLFPELGPAIGQQIDRALGYPLGTPEP